MACVCLPFRQNARRRDVCLWGLLAATVPAHAGRRTGGWATALPHEYQSDSVPNTQIGRGIYGWTACTVLIGSTYQWLMMYRKTKYHILSNKLFGQLSGLKFVIFISHKQSRVWTRYFTRLCIIISSTCVIFLVNLDDFFAVVYTGFHESCGFHQICSQDWNHIYCMLSLWEDAMSASIH